MVCQAHPSSLPGERREAPPSALPAVSTSPRHGLACPSHLCDAPSAASPPSLPGLTRQSMRHRSNQPQEFETCAASWMRGSSPRMTDELVCQPPPFVMAGLVAAIYVDAPSPASPPSLPGSRQCQPPPSVMAGLVAAIYVDAPSPASPPSLPGLPRQSMRHRQVISRTNFELAPHHGCAGQARA